MKNYLVVLLSTVLLVACGGGGGGGNDDFSSPGGHTTTPMETTESTPPASPPTASTPPAPPPTESTPPAPPATESTPPAPPPTESTPPTSTTMQHDYETWGMWASFNWDHFSVGGPISSDDGTAWTVQGIPTGSVDNIPRNANPRTNSVEYTGQVWGRVYDGFTRTPSGQHFDNGERVRGEMTATYRPLSANRSMAITFTLMKKEYPSGGSAPLPLIKFIGRISDTATFSLSAEGLEDRYGRETGTVTGSFYGPNGESVAGTFWYRRNGHRIEGALGGNLEGD